MFEVPYGQDPYSAIGKYIRENITIIEDIIAVIEINGVETNELFMVDMNEDGYFIWNSDWYEGEEKVVLIDFFPVSEAINSSAQPDVLVGDTISRQAAIDEIEYELEMINSALDSITLDFNTRERLRQRRGEAREILNSIQQLPSAQTEIILCKDCKHRPTRNGDGWIDFPTERCPCQNADDFYYSWMPDDNWFCGNAERREG